MASLEIIIKKLIEKNGPISVEHYMDLALSHPEFGYYKTIDPIGTSGDFITAPEISQMFGEIIGIWVTLMHKQLSDNAQIKLIELGPGHGVLINDILRSISKIDKSPEKFETHLVEINPKLKRVQQYTLKDREVIWHNSINSIPPGPSIIIANEFFDALPVNQLVYDTGCWHERQISVTNDINQKLIFSSGPEAKEEQLPSEIIKERTEEGSIFEFSPAREKMVKILAKKISVEGGVILIIDYGHTQTAIGETLQAVKNHKFHPVLVDPGTADLTAHLDFQALQRAISNIGVLHWGPIMQSQFLRRLGIETRASYLRNNSNTQSGLEIQRALDRLIDPEQMGSMFKAIAITDDSSPMPPGFENCSYNKFINTY
tara:strand:- start:55780 stop:56898 length:1119 start_codon:yes stop_codon:yes gene_type:complete